MNVDASESGAKPKAVVGATGDTNLAGLKAQLRDDAMQFGCFKVLGVDQKGAVTSTRLKVRAAAGGRARARARLCARTRCRRARRAHTLTPPLCSCAPSLPPITQLVTFRESMQTGRPESLVRATHAYAQRRRRIS